MNIILVIVFLAVQLYVGILLVLSCRAFTCYNNAGDCCRDALLALLKNNVAHYHYASKKIVFWETRGDITGKMISLLTFGILRIN